MQGQTSAGKETESSSSILTTENGNDPDVKLGNRFEKDDRDASLGPKPQLIERYVIFVHLIAMAIKVPSAMLYIYICCKFYLLVLFTLIYGILVAYLLRYGAICYVKLIYNIVILQLYWILSLVGNLCIEVKSINFRKNLLVIVDKQHKIQPSI